VGNRRGEGGGGGGEGKAGEGKGKGEGKGEGKEGTPKVWLTPPMFEILKNTLVSIMITMQMALATEALQLKMTSF